MFLKYNTSNIIRERRVLNIDKERSVINNTDGYISLKLRTYTPHKLNIGDVIVFNKDIETSYSYNETLAKLKNGYHVVNLLKKSTITKNGYKNESVYEKGFYKLGKDINYNDDIVKLSSNEIDSVFDKYNSLTDKLVVGAENFSKYDFTISYEKTKKLHVDYVQYGNEFNIAKISGNIPIFLNEGDEFVLTKTEYAYNRIRAATSDDKNKYKNVNYNPNGSYVYAGYEKIVFGDGLYSWVGTSTNIKCTAITETYFKYAKTVDNTYDDIYVDDVLEIEDNRFINANGELYDNITFYEYSENINVTLPLVGDNRTELNDENISKTYFNEKKKELISIIPDYEKKCFTPYSRLNNMYRVVSKIRFNLFFRDRSGSSDWSTNDLKGWNQWKINENGSFNSNPTTLLDGDLLGNLNFTDDDVYYHKKKISKSFLRLSFYEKNTPFNNMLLFYSTIFLDSNELYTKYIKSLEYKNESQSLVNFSGSGVNNLTVSFTVNDRYNKNKSSEGFYLYLFPDGIESSVDNNGNLTYSKRTIYMKAEFNHAGYGKTIPLFYPTTNSNSILSLTDSNFPKSLINENGDLSELYRQLYIPVTITYDPNIMDYIYYFNIENYNNNVITLNLYEPKVNPSN